MIWAQVGAALMVLAVGTGAFAAHGLKSRLSPEMMNVFEVGVRYLVYHALAMFVVAWLSTIRVVPFLSAAGTCFILGILFFSGSLCVYATTGFTPLAVLAPVGGSLFIAGWVLVLLAIRKI